MMSVKLQISLSARHKEFLSVHDNNFIRLDSVMLEIRPVLSLESVSDTLSHSSKREELRIEKMVSVPFMSKANIAA